MLSGVLMTVARRPISAIVPVTPPAVTKWPTRKGLSPTMNTPAARFERMLPHAVPIAIPIPASSAANVVVSTPKKPRIATMRTTSSRIESAEPM
jgi:hypothetical protein